MLTAVSRLTWRRATNGSLYALGIGLVWASLILGVTLVYRAYSL